MQYMQLAASEIWVTLIFAIIMYLFRKELRGKKLTYTLLIVCVARLLSDAVSWGFDGRPGAFFGTLTVASNYVTFVTNDLVSLVFSIYIWHLIRREDEKPALILKAYWAFEIATIIALTANLYFGWFYCFDADNNYCRGDFYRLTHVAPIAALFVVLWLLTRYRDRFSPNLKFLGWSYFVLMAGATAYEFMTFGLSLQTYAQAFTALMAFFMGEIKVRQHLEVTQRHLTEKNAALKLEEKKVEAALKAEELKTTIISSIAAAYNEIIVIDFALKKYDVLSEQRGKYRMTGDAGSFGELTAKLFATYVAADAQNDPDVRAFLDFNTIEARLADENAVMMEVKSPAGAWNSAAFIANRRDAAGTPPGVWWTHCS